MKRGTEFCRLTIIAAIVFPALLPTIVSADDVQSLKAENVELRQRVDKLTSEMEQIKALLAEKGLPTTTPPVTTKNVTAKPFDIQLYGMIKLDAARDDSRTSAGNYARWVESEGGENNDAQFNMTANQTRLGMLINGPPLNDIKTTGQIECDFYGAAPNENKPQPMLRLGFVKADWVDLNFSLLAGQTWDIISPLNAPTVNYSVAWWQGNIGYRRPQIRLTKGLKLTEDVELKLEVGATRTISDTKFFYTSSTDPDSGADSGFPTLQGRASVSFPSFNKKPATLGVSGHWGQEEIHTTNSAGVVNGNYNVASWSGNVDLKLPVTDWLLLQAEGFIGSDLYSYLGGIGQGYDSKRQEAIRAIGGWTAASFGPWGKWQFSLGAGIDNVDSDDVTANAKSPPRLSNLVTFGNTYYSLTENVQLALEISYLHTTYKQADRGDDLREQFSVIFKF